MQNLETKTILLPKKYYLKWSVRTLIRPITVDSFFFIKSQLIVKHTTQIQKSLNINFGFIPSE
jgi:hypothetical protein